MSYKDAAAAGGVHEDTLDSWRKRGAVENNTIYSRFFGQIDKAAEATAIAYLEAVRKSIMESPVKVREHVKTDDKCDHEGNPPGDVAAGYQGRTVVA